MENNVLLAITTFPNAETARQIGTALVERQLAACVNLVDGAISIYRWEGRVCTENEVVGLIKTTKDACEQLESALLELHPYDCPELVFLPLAGGAAGYLEWVAAAVGKE